MAIEVCEGSQLFIEYVESVPEIDIVYGFLALAAYRVIFQCWKKDIVN